MKIAIFIDHDIMIRHFIMSGVFKALCAVHEVTFVFPGRNNSRIGTEISTLDLPGAVEHVPEHTARQNLWNRVFVADSLRLRLGKQYATLRGIVRATNNTKAVILHTILGLPGIHGLLRRFTAAKLEKLPNTPLNELLDRMQPDMILHPTVLRGVYLNDLIAIGRERNIPCVLIMNSWDNPSTKQAVVGEPDCLLVWGDQTHQHAVSYMKMPPEKVIKFGVAQFEVFRVPPKMSRQAFCEEHDIPEHHKIILYAGSSKGTDEFQHLLTLDEKIASGEFGEMTIVYRPHPWGDGGHGGSRIIEHSWKHVRIEQSMREYLERVSKGESMIFMADYHRAHTVLNAVDAVVSPLSTMLVEGALHRKPVLCFLPENESNAVHFQVVRTLAHFEEMFTMPEFPVARSLNDLTAQIPWLLSKTEDLDFLERLYKATGFFIEQFEEDYGSRLVRFCENYANSRAQTINSAH